MRRSYEFEETGDGLRTLTVTVAHPKVLLFGRRLLNEHLQPCCTVTIEREVLTIKGVRPGGSISPSCKTVSSWKSNGDIGRGGMPELCRL